MHTLNANEFEKLVREAILELPQKIRDKMENIAVVVEETPSPEQLKRSGLRRGDLLLGLYEGVPRGGRGPYYTLVLPDKISIFKNSIETIAQTPLAIKFQVRKTVRHEIAHHFGFSDEQLRD